MKNKKAFVYRTATTDNDVHDSRQAHSYLQAGNDIEQKDPLRAIALNVEVLIDAYLRKKKPAFSWIEERIRNDQPFRIFQNTDACNSEKNVEWDPRNSCLTISTFHGQCTTKFTYEITEIDENNIAWLAIEEFIGVAKKVPYIQRFYHEPFETKSDAETEITRLKTTKRHKLDNNVFLMPIDKTTLTNDYE